MDATLLLAMVWVLSGLFTNFLMKKADESKGKNYTGNYWFKNRPDKNIRIIGMILVAPLSLLLGIVAMMDWCEEE